MKVMNIFLQNLPSGEEWIRRFPKVPFRWHRINKDRSECISGRRFQKTLLLTMGTATHCPFLVLLGTEGWFPFGESSFPHCEWSWGDGKEAPLSPSQQAGPWAVRGHRLLSLKRGSIVTPTSVCGAGVRFSRSVLSGWGRRSAAAQGEARRAAASLSGKLSHRS